MSIFTVEEKRLLRASDEAEDADGRHERKRSSKSSRGSWRDVLRTMPRPTVTVGESIAAMTDEDRRWMIENGYLEVSD